MTPATTPSKGARLPANTMSTLVALAAGLALGMGAKLFDSETLVALEDTLAPAGAAWVAVLRMMVLPVVVCLLISGISGAGGSMLGRLGATSVAVFGAMLAIGASISVSFGPILIEALQVPRGALLGAVSGEVSPRVAAPTLDWSNVLASGGFAQALANGELLPVMFVTVVVALALRRIEADARQRLLGLCSALQALTLMILSWILAVAPVAVFCLAFSMAARRGALAALVVGSFVLAVVLLLIVFLITLYPATVWFGRVSLRSFARAAAPAQAVAIGTRSSYASLPALLESGTRLGLPEHVNAFVMPLSVSVFKANRLLSGPLKMLFLAHVYDIEVSALTIGAYVAMEMVLSIGTPGTPNGGTYPSTAALLAIGIPMEGIVLLHSVYALPDVIMTLTNVTADLSAAAIVARFVGVSAPAPAPALQTAVSA